MAVQNALVQISLKGAPSTAVMTSNAPASRWMSARCCPGAIRPMWPRRATERRMLCRRMWLHRWLRPRCGMRGRAWHVVFGFACRPRPARVCDGFYGQVKRSTVLMSRTDLCPHNRHKPAALSPGGWQARYGPSDRRCSSACGCGLRSASRSTSRSGSSSTMPFGPARPRRSSVSRSSGLRCARAGTA